VTARTEWGGKASHAVHVTHHCLLL